MNTGGRGYVSAGAWLKASMSIGILPCDAWLMAIRVPMRTWRRHGPLVTPRWSDQTSGKYVDKSAGRPSTTEYRNVLKGKDQSNKKVKSMLQKVARSPL